MKSWKISEAKARLSEVLAACVEEPQVLYNRKQPVAAVIDMEAFAAFQAYREACGKPRMQDLLDELVQINEAEPDLELSERTDRDLPEFE